MSQEWRNRDPIEDTIYNGSRPDAHSVGVDEMSHKISEVKEDINSNSVEISRKMMELIVLSKQIERKTDRLKDEVQSKIDE